MQNSTAATDATDSDFNPTTGQSDVVTIDTTQPTSSTARNNPTVDLALVTPGTGSLGDFVWKDNNNNGLFDTNEPPVAGVQVELFTVTGNTTSTTALQTTVTDGTGRYLFAGLPSGNYRVKFTVPASLTDACQLTKKPNAGRRHTRFGCGPRHRLYASCNHRRDAACQQHGPE